MRKIGVFSATRAEYGLLYWLLNEVSSAEECALQLFVGGTHLSSDFGHTIDQILADGFSVTQALDFLSDDNSANGIAQSMARAIVLGTEALNQHQPDILVILGDRFEALAMAQAAMISGVAIAHIHGGELTEGAIDDAIRHAITKLSHLHFVATERYRQRVIQLGEAPNRVFNYGAPGLDSIHKLTHLNRTELSNSVNFDLSGDYFLVTYHPETLALDNGKHALLSLLEVLNQFSEYKVVITYPNADAGSKAFIDIYQAYQNQQPQRVLLVKSLGQLRYLSCLKHAAAVIGNSSSGIIEAPSFGKPTINIGDRQKGRECATTVINCGIASRDIHSAIDTALEPKFKRVCDTAVNPYGGINVASKMADKLKSYPLNGLLEKRFFDVNQLDVNDQRANEDFNHDS